MSQATGSSALDRAANTDNAGLGAMTAGNDELDKDAFLKLLITQFQHQDPLNPMEDKEFIAQLAQFSALEQAMKMNEGMEHLIVATDQQTTISVTDYIGKEVSARGYDISKKDGVMSSVQYTPTESVQDLYVNIIDKSTNQVVATLPLEAKSTGVVHEFVWDGKLTNGSTALDGVYKVAFAAKSDAGEPVFVDTSVSGRVTGTRFVNGEYELRMEDGRVVLLVNIREVVEAKKVGEEEDEEVEGETFAGTSGDDYLVGGAGPDTIQGKGGNDIIVYEPNDELVDGGSGYDFLIAEGDVDENAKNYEAILRGTYAPKIKNMGNLVDMGLVFKPDGEIDTASVNWTNHWRDVGDGQWASTVTGADGELRPLTIEIMSEVPAPTPPAAASMPASRSGARRQASAPRSADAPMNGVDFSEALHNGMKNVRNGTSGSLSNNASNVINRYMQAMNG